MGSTYRRSHLADAIMSFASADNRIRYTNVIAGGQGDDLRAHDGGAEECAYVGLQGLITGRRDAEGMIRRRECG